MSYKFNPLETVNYYDTLLVGVLLSLTTVPFLWLLSHENMAWVFTCAVLWSIGVFLIYYPFLEYVFPLLISRMGAFILSSLLALMTFGINSMLLITLLTDQDWEMILNESIFTLPIDFFLMVIFGYTLIAGLFVANLQLILTGNKKLFLALQPQELWHLLQYYALELIFILIVPFILLVCMDIPYTTRLIFSVVSIMLGLSLFLYKMHLPLLEQRFMFSFLMLSLVTLLNS